MPSFELTALQKKAGTWQVSLEPEHAELVPTAGGVPLVIPRSEIVGRLELAEIWGGQGVLTVTRSEKPKKLQFKLGAEQRETVDRWIGPRTTEHLKLLLRRRYAFGIPIGLLLILFSLPIPADPATGLEAVPASPLTGLLGVMLIVMWLVARRWPMPRLLLFDTIWFVLLVASLLYDMATGKASLLWLAWIVLIYFFVKSGLREYRRYRNLLERPRQTETA